MRCRICHNPELIKVFSLGLQPHCDHFLRKEELQANEPFYPLELFFCEKCALVQLGFTVPSQVMFGEYPYLTGTTKTLRDHFENLAREIFRRFLLTSSDLVVDIGSNDGTFLKSFQRLGVKTLGVDPAANLVQLAAENGIETVHDFFTREVGHRIASERGKAKVITAAGVFFHVPDLHDFVAGVQDLMSDDGVFVVQAQYLLDLFEKNSFDNIYHEHMCLYTLRPLTVLFKQFGMEIVDVKRIDIHGGSFIAYIQKEGVTPVQKSVIELLSLEQEKKMYASETYTHFASKAENVKNRLVDLLRQFRSEGKRIFGYGAPAKGNTLLNYCQISTDLVDCIVEKNLLKCGLYSPGMHIPVISEQEVQKTPPDYYLLLAWNFLTEFLEKERGYREQGGKFIIPIPEPHIL